MKKFFAEFKEFISKGNVMDMAVAVIIGAAFSKIVTSLVSDIIMPLISKLTGGLSIEDWKWVITPADPVNDVAESALCYGVFLQNVIDFLIVAFVLFVVLKIFLAGKEKLKAIEEKLIKKEEEEEKEEEEPEETELDILKQIRDSLANKEENEEENE